MARVEVIMPKMGESIVEATITGWLKQPGDTVEQDETILEIATDKVDSEVPSPVDGKLVEVLFAEGDTVEVDAVIAYIETEAAAGDDAPSAAPTSSESAPKADADPTPDKQPEPSPEKQPEPAMAAAVGADPKLTGALLDSPESGRFYSPLVLNIARTENIPMDELDRLPGTGKDGRVTKKDILSYVKLREEGGAPQPATSGASNGASNGQSKPQAKNGQAKTAKSAPQKAAPLAVSDPKIEETKTGVKFSPVASGGVQGIPQKTYTYNGGYEIQEMDRMRKMIADNMAISKQVSPHVSSFVECDVTTLFNWRKRNKHAFMEKYGEKLTFTPIFVMALAKAIREYPAINISVVGDKIIRKKDVNIGMAVAQPSGNLIVATIRNADELNLAGLTKRVNDLAKRARENKLSPDDVADATYTLSNVGTFGNIAGTPILMQPQVAILATGVIQKKPAVIETPEGDMIGIRQQMLLSHSYDHRVVDGSLGGSFVFRVGQILENWDAETDI